MDYKELFSKTPPTRLFFRAALPGCAGMLASALYQLIDGIFVGRILGDTAFAALNLAMPFVIINFALADLIGVGSAVPISVRLGAGEEDKANNIFTCACLMIIAAGVLIGGILFASAPALISLMGADGTLHEQAVQYLRVYAICSPVTTIIFAVDNYLRICGKIQGSMILNIFMSILSVVLEFTFLYVFRWGIWGAALATCSGMIICALIAFYPFIRGRMQLRFRRPRFSIKMIRQIVSCGAPSFLNNIAGRITSILMNTVLLQMGGERAVSVYGILMFADGVVQPLLYGLCDSLQPAVGYNWGAGNLSRVKAIEKRCFLASAILALAAASIIFMFPEKVTTLFMSDTDEATMTMAVTALGIFSMTYLTRWFSFATQSFMSAIERPLQASFISVGTALVFPVILIAALWGLGLQGLWLNFPLTALLAAILSGVILLLFFKKIRRNKAAGEPIH